MRTSMIHFPNAFNHRNFTLRDIDSEVRSKSNILNSSKQNNEQNQLLNRRKNMSYLTQIIYLKLVWILTIESQLKKTINENILDKEKIKY